MKESQLRPPIIICALGLLVGIPSKGLKAESFYIGTCQVTEDPFEAIQAPKICFKDQLQLTSLWTYRNPLSRQLTGYPKQNTLAHNRLYSGVHLNAHVSFHHQTSFYGILETDSLDRFQTTMGNEYSFIQIGHPLLDSFHGSFGRLDLPFGLDYRIISEHLQFYKRNFWDRYQWGTKFSWIRHDDLTIETGMISQSPRSNLENLKSHRLDIWSIRISKDIPDLEGTKLLLSYAHQDGIKRKLGFAMINSIRDQSTAFEWVRIIPREGDHDFEQIFRFNHQGKWINQSRWYFEYENIRFHSWNSVIGREQEFFSDHVRISLELAYFGDKPSDGKSGWLIEAGIQVNL